MKPSRRPKRPQKVRKTAKGPAALIGVMRSLRKSIRRSDVEEMERLIAEGGQPPEAIPKA